jgi:hypothetical protein
MNLSDFKQGSQFAKINALLESLYGLSIDRSQSVEDLQSVLDNYEQKKQSMLESGVVGMTDPDYTKSTLICEAIRIHLREIAPNRRKKQRRTT